MVRKVRARKAKRGSKKVGKKPFRPGDIVGVRAGDEVVPARILEDRGLLGSRERLVRVSVGETTSATSSFEVLYSTLLPASQIPADKLKKYRAASQGVGPG